MRNYYDATKKLILLIPPKICANSNYYIKIFQDYLNEN